jgi:DNA-binding NarL/FixJ family response regulator
MIVFARQNVASDPPFSRLDIISCRNLLIYFEPGLQRKISPVFHYALKPPTGLSVALPGLNGDEVAQRIREQQRGKRRPLLVALTGWGQDEDRRRSEHAGFDAHLVKPVDEVALSRLLAEASSRKHDS